MSKKKLLLSLALILALAGGNLVFADSTVVPVSTLAPAAPLEKPQLTGVGGKLIFSDSPETFSETGAFYRDEAEGEFRVFWHHQNTADHLLTVSVAITNESAEPVELYSKGSGVATNMYVDVAGQTALADFLRTRGTTRYLATLEPGEHYWIDAPTGSMLTTSGIVQLEAVTKHAHRPTTVTVTVLGYDTRPEHPEQLPILPPSIHTRGTFPHFDRIGTIRYNTSMGNVYLSVDSAASGPWKDDMPGEYEVGWDAVDGKEVINNGNYGVLYHWSVEITNDEHHPRTVNLYLNPSGGFGHYALQWKEEILESGFLSYLDAWNFKSFTLGANGNTYRAEMSLTGGSAGPQKLYFTNVER